MPSGSIVFVDTHVLLYAQDPREPAKQAAAERWLTYCWTQRCGRLSTQVLNELYVNLRKAAPGMQLQASRDVVRRYRAWQPGVVDEHTVDGAWHLQEKFSFSFRDALIVAAAQQLGCTRLLTEDLQHGLRIEQLQIVNPFHAGPETLDATA